MRDYSSILCFVGYLTDCPIFLTWLGEPVAYGLQTLAKGAALYNIIVNIMAFYHHGRDSNPDPCGENQTCEVRCKTYFLSGMRDKGYSLWPPLRIISTRSRVDHYWHWHLMFVCVVPLYQPSCRDQNYALWDLLY